jgi:hypothetical protein
VWFEGGFSKRAQLLGVKFVLDAEPPYVEVPQDKVDKTVSAIDAALLKNWVPADECQVLLGLMVFHGRVLLSGKWHLPFMVRSLAQAITTGVAHMHPHWQTELVWWRTLLTQWNRVSIIVPPTLTEGERDPMHTPMTDASRSKEKQTGAAGAMFGVYYQQWKFTPREILNLNIMELEGFALVVWLQQLCSEEKHLRHLRGKRFVMRCDNDPFVECVNRRHSTHPAVAFLLGEIHRLCSLHSFDLTLVYINTKLNVGADALSRNDWPTFTKWMQTELGTHHSRLISVPVQETYRKSIASTMIAAKHSATTTPTPPRTANGRRSGSGSGSAGGRASPSGSSHAAPSTRPPTTRREPR